MNRGAVTRAGLAVLAASTLALAPEAVAAKKALGKIKTRTAVATAIGHGTIATATAQCPRRHRAVGGGFSSTPQVDGAFPFVYESLKGDQRSWRASAQQNSLTAPGTALNLTALVYCRKGAPATTTSTASVATPQMNQAGPTATATCPGGGKLQAGGFSTPPPLALLTASAVRNIVTSSLAVADDSWQVGVVSQLSSTVTSYAYCVRRKPPTAVATAGPPSTASAFAPYTADATCPAKRKATAGGFLTPSTFGNTFRINESIRRGRTWHTGAVRSGGAAGSQAITSIAYCVRRAR